MKNLICILAIGTLGMGMPALSQDTISISMEELMKEVRVDNYQMKLAEQQVKLASADYRQSNALFLPSLSVSHTAITTNNPLMAFGSKLNQEILTQADFDPASLNDPDRIDNFSTEILLLQPLLNLDGVYARQAAKIQQEAYRLQTQRTEEYLELEVSKYYKQLQLAYEAVEVLENAEKTSNEGVKMILDYFDEGLVQKSDVLSVQVRASEVENQLRYARSNVQNTSDQLSFLMGKEAENVVYKPVDRAPDFTEPATYPQQISAARKDILAMDMSVTGYEKMLKSSKMNFLPRVNAFGSYQLYDQNLFGFNASGYLVGAKLSWNLFDGYKTIGKTAKARHQAEKAKMENDQYKLQQQIDLNKANRQLKDAESKVRLTRLAQEQSKEAYRIRKDRFTEGLEKTTDLLMSETQMFQKELEYRQAIFEYNFTKEYLKFLTR